MHVRVMKHYTDYAGYGIMNQISFRLVYQNLQDFFYQKLHILQITIQSTEYFIIHIKLHASSLVTWSLVSKINVTLSSF